MMMTYLVSGDEGMMKWVMLWVRVKALGKVGDDNNNKKRYQVN